MNLNRTRRRTPADVLPSHINTPSIVAKPVRDRPAPRKIRVLLVITGLAAGGATNVVLDLAQHFHNHPRFALQLVTGPPPPGRTDVTHLAFQRGIETRVVPSLVNTLNPPVNLKAVADIRQVIRQSRADIVHTHSSVAGVVGRLAARTAGVPIIIHHVHGWAMHNDMAPTRRALCVTLERFCARFTSRIITVSRPDIEKGLAHRICPPERFALIYNGIDVAKFRRPAAGVALRAELGLAPDNRLVAMIGRLDRQKNPLDFIRAAAIVCSRDPQVQFLLVGDGALRPECERLIDALGLRQRLFLLGYRNDVDRILAAVTLTAMSSLWEGLPIAFMESLSAGKPIVANDVDGASDIVVDGETGFLVPPHEPAEMALRILHLLADEGLCEQMGRTARQRAQQFSVERMVAAVESLYDDLHARYLQAGHDAAGDARLRPADNR